MALDQDANFIRYLEAKKSIDDRALCRTVRDRLRQALPSQEKERPLRILELGGGIGTMAERLIEAGELTHAAYTLVDRGAPFAAVFRRRVAALCARENLDLRWPSRNTACLQGQKRRITLDFVPADIFDFFKSEASGRQWDLGLAHAFMDLVDPAEVLPRLCAAIRPGGLLYLTLNFDGETILLPEVDPVLDADIIRLYHQSMDERTVAGRPAGDSRTGRHLFGHLQKAGTQILACGSSDWIVFAGPGGYTGDEAFLLHAIIDTMDAEIRDHPRLEENGFNDWVRRRHTQVDNGDLILIAKQLDFLARVAAG